MVGVPGRLASLPVVFHGRLGRAGVPAGWSAGRSVVGGSATRSMSWVQAVCQGQSCGRCRVRRRAEVAIRQGIWISLRRTVAVVARARSEAATSARRGWRRRG